MTDVLILGAGAAGMTAAYDLFWTDYNVKILEASDKVGGRLRKEANFTDFPIDLGAEWIHVNPNILDQIVDDPDIDVDVDTTRYSWRTNALRNNGRWRRMNLGNDWKFQDYTWFDFFNDYLAVDVMDEIEFGCQVTEISWQSNPVWAKCSNGLVHEAEHLIVTVSTAILSRGDIKFIPELPSKYTNAFETADMPNTIKMWLKFDTKFWGGKKNFGFASEISRSDAYNRIFYEATQGQDTDEIVLGVFNRGRTADVFRDVSDADMIKQTIDDLIYMFGDRVGDSFLDEALIQNWEKESFIAGSYTQFSNGGYARAIRTMRKSLGGSKLFFAGEAVPYRDFEWGFAHGAALSGRAVASRIMAIYGDRRRVKRRARNLRGAGLVASNTTLVELPLAEQDGESLGLRAHFRVPIYFDNEEGTDEQAEVGFDIF